MSSTVPSVEQIEAREQDLLDRLPIDARHVPRSESEEYDAELVEPFQTSPPLTLVNHLELESGTPLELKTCRRWLDVAFSNGSRRRGRFFVNEQTHSKLVDRSGAYVWVVLDDHDDVLGGRVTPAVAVDGSFSWHGTGTTYVSRRSAVRWPDVVPREVLDVDW